MIDEIDLHLHPKWQWKVIEALRETFEKIQFIIATHSPIVISSAKGANLILLDNDQKITYLPDCYDMKWKMYSGIVRKVFQDRRM